MRWLFALILLASCTGNLYGEAVFIDTAPRVQVGDTVIVDISMNDVHNLAGAQVSLRYDEDLLSYINSSPGTVFDDDNTTLFFEPVQYDGFLDDLLALRTNALGVSGSGTIATIRFTALSEGQVAFELVDMVLANSTHQLIDTSILGANVTIYNEQVDSQDPFVDILSPSDGALLSGSSSLEATASDNVGVVGVSFELNGAQLGDEILEAPYSIQWNTAEVPDGQYIVEAVARDAAGNTASSSASVTVENHPSDGEDLVAPLVTITEPSEGASLEGRVTLSAHASDNIGVSSIQFFMNGDAIGASGTGNSHSISIHMKRMDPGNYIISAVAMDDSGNIGTDTVNAFVEEKGYNKRK